MTWPRSTSRRPPSSHSSSSGSASSRAPRCSPAQLGNLPTWISGYAQVADDHVCHRRQRPAGDRGSWRRRSARRTSRPTSRPTRCCMSRPGTWVTPLDALIAQVKPQMRGRSQGQRTAHRGRAAVRERRWRRCSTSRRTAPSASASTASACPRASWSTLKDQAVGERRLQTLLGLLRLSGGSLPVGHHAARTSNGTTVTTITLQPEAGIPADLPFDRRGQRRHRGWPPVPRSGRLRGDGPGPGPRDLPGHLPPILDRARPPPAPPTRVSSGSMSRPRHRSWCRWRAPTSPSYETNIKPWVDALDSFMATATVDGDIASLKALLFVK